jgi:hypothetical protein
VGGCGNIIQLEAMTSRFSNSKLLKIMAYFEVEKYQVFKFADNGVESASAVIQAWGGGNHATLVFLKPGVKMKESSAETFYFKDTEFAVMIDLFRNERPVHVNTTKPFFIMTEQEGTGDHEISRDEQQEQNQNLRPRGVDLRTAIH